MTTAKGLHRAQRDGQFAVSCWCERAIVCVAAGVIGDETKSCGRPGCERPVAHLIPLFRKFSPRLRDAPTTAVEECAASALAPSADAPISGPVNPHG